MVIGSTGFSAEQKAEIMPHRTIDSYRFRAEYERRG
jgi:hypothetical protein